MTVDMVGVDVGDVANAQRPFTFLLLSSWKLKAISVYHVCLLDVLLLSYYDDKLLGVVETKAVGLPAKISVTSKAKVLNG